MARRLSRRVLAEYVAGQLVDGKARTEVIRQLAAYLVDTRRTGELMLIVRDIDHFLARRGHTNIHVTTAFEMTSETQKAVEALLAKQLSGSRLFVEKTVDRSVLGGIRIDAPGQQLDRTIAHQLTALRTANRKV